MRVLVYTHRKQADAGQREVARLRAEGHGASWRDARGFDGDLEKCERVVTDSEDVAAAYLAAGVEVAGWPRPAATDTDPNADAKDAAPTPKRRYRRRES